VELEKSAAPPGDLGAYVKRAIDRI
jgi:hypothetical protein